MVGGTPDIFGEDGYNDHSNSLCEHIDMGSAPWPWEIENNLVRYEITHQKKGAKGRDYIYLIETQGEPVEILRKVKKLEVLKEICIKSPIFNNLKFLESEAKLETLKESLEMNIGHIYLPHSKESYFGEGKGFSEEDLIEIRPFKANLVGDFQLSLFSFSPTVGDLRVKGFYHLPSESENLRDVKADCYEHFLGKGKINVRKRNLEFLASTIDLE